MLDLFHLVLFTKPFFLFKEGEERQLLIQENVPFGSELLFLFVAGAIATEAKELCGLGTKIRGDLAQCAFTGELREEKFYLKTCFAMMDKSHTSDETCEVTRAEG